MRQKSLPLVTKWVDLEGLWLSEISRVEKDKYYMMILLYMWSLERPNSEKQNRMVVTWGLGGGEEWGYGHREFFLL